MFQEVLFGNNKGRTISDPAFAFLELNIDLIFKSLHFYLNEINIFDICIVAYYLPPPIQDKFPCYSLWTFSSLWEYPDKMDFFCFIEPVKFICQHVLLPTCSLPKIRISFSKVFATQKAPLFPILFLSQ